MQSLNTPDAQHARQRQLEKESEADAVEKQLDTMPPRWRFRALTR